MQLTEENNEDNGTYSSAVISEIILSEKFHFFTWQPATSHAHYRLVRIRSSRK